MNAGLLFDATQCIGCGTCAGACKEANGLPPEVDPVLTARTWTTVTPVGETFVRHLCMHCLEPTCASVCPVAALQVDATGAVTYAADRCMGCRYCMMACPFDVPRYEWHQAVPVVGKCILCAGRVRKGQPTACAETCPTGATRFGDRDALLAEARKRILDDPGRYKGGIRGQVDVGGTRVLMLSGVGFKGLGLREDLPREAPALHTWRVLSRVPDFVAAWAALLFGIHWITARRSDVTRKEEA